MKLSILNRLTQLGGDTRNVSATSLLDDWLSISFPYVLLWRNMLVEYYWIIDEFHQAHQDTYRWNPASFYEQLVVSIFALNNEPRHQLFFRQDLFTPLTAGTADYDAWQNWFQNYANLAEIEVVVGKNTQTQLLRIFHAYGYPDEFYVALDDPHPENPTVFGTDHQAFFKEIINYGSLEDFLQQFLNPAELCLQAQEYLSDSRFKIPDKWNPLKTS